MSLSTIDKNYMNDLLLSLNNNNNNNKFFSFISP